MLVTCLRCNRHVDTGASLPGEIVRCGCGTGILVPEGPRSAGKMGCPACGAPVDPDEKTCAFCSTRLATVVCPRCFGTVFDGARHCAHCGEALSSRTVIHHGDVTGQACPRCADRPVLRVELVAGYPLGRCDGCEGLWVDRETVERIYRDRQTPTVEALSRAGAGSQPESASGPLVPQGYIPCPVCGKLMHRQNFARCSGVIIDVCRDHGTWFDADELRRISVFVAQGGLEKAAARERDELREEIRKLRAKRLDQNRQERCTGGMATPWAGRFQAESAALGLVGKLLSALFG